MSCEHFLTAVNEMLSGGLKLYLDYFVVPFVGDWPLRYCIRRLIYSDASPLPAALQNVITVIGPMHISLNAREYVLLIFVLFSFS